MIQLLFEFESLFVYKEAIIKDSMAPYGPLAIPLKHSISIDLLKINKPGINTLPVK